MTKLFKIKCNKGGSYYNMWINLNDVIYVSRPPNMKFWEVHMSDRYVACVSPSQGRRVRDSIK